ncbi:MAG: hypothetical protein FWE08_05650 [Oscillospiraceae bacterium]|nr:hypothetical protein [Oscillospiraceae bacterium]
MKRTILFALLAVMFLAMVTGCRAYRRNTVTAPTHEITNTHGRTNRSFHHRNDGHVGTHTNRSHLARDGHHARTHVRNHRHDGLVTDTDGIIGNGTHADRPSVGSVYGSSRNLDGGRMATGTTPGTMAR